MGTKTTENKVVWSCYFCGHIFGLLDSRRHCAHCGATPARWLGAPMVENHRADANVPSVAEPEPELLPTEQTNSQFGLFGTSPPGTQGLDVNPELRIRY